MYRKILVPLDGSKLAECVLPHVKNLVKGDSIPEVILVRVIEPISIPYGRKMAEITSLEQLESFGTHNRIEAEKYLKRIEGRLTKAGVKSRSIVASGNASEEIVRLVTQEKADLLIISTHGRSGISRLVWGSVADRVIRSVNVPLLIIHAPGCGQDFKES